MPDEPATKSPYDDETVDPYGADDTKNPHEEAAPADEPAGDDPPKKRGPGRPRKTAA